MKFSLKAKEGSARVGVIETSRGSIKTPVFMPVATQGSVKALDNYDLEKIGAEIILGNVYHLNLRPGSDLIQRIGGLHKFMNWDRPILTDSGGFQGFSLQHLRKISEEGINFKSHIDGSSHLLTPEKVVQIQFELGSNIWMPLDVCLPPDSNFDQIDEALGMTSRWMERSLDAKKEFCGDLFGIIQGGLFTELRQKSVDMMTSFDLPGYSIGGLSVGESKEEMYQTLAFTTQQLPENKPRYLMGVGSPEDLLVGVKNGVDMFDCVLPTRVARNGALYTRFGRKNITNKLYRELDEKFDELCDCYFCENFSVAYLHHLFRSKEYLAYKLASIHNLRFLVNLMNQIRVSILNNQFENFYIDYLKEYKIADEHQRLLQRKN
ncbi:MAG: tRNA guanosine(34) transglycosylase Tgt [SAR202 cluster bacterium]|nr:tRNA guanosine(34) transglycosylase Tgt [SAR202 cluster bacterium]